MKVSKATDISDEDLLASLSPVISELDEFRATILSGYKFQFVLIAVLSVLAFFSGYLFIALLIAFLFFRNAVKAYFDIFVNYRNGYKEILLPHIAKVFGNFTYVASSSFPTRMLEKSGLLPSYDHAMAEDFFEGTYNNAHLEFFEISLSHNELLKRGRKRHPTIFRGWAVVLTFEDTKFEGHTIFNKNENAVIEFLHTRISKMEKVKLVDPEFTDLYDVYSTKQVEAHYVFDPATIEYIKSVKDHDLFSGLTGAFYDDKIVLLLNSRYDLFMPPKLLPDRITELFAKDNFDHTADVKMVVREVRQIFSVVDLLCKSMSNKIN